MILSLTAKDGVRVGKLGPGTWVVAGEGPRISALEAQVAALAALVGGIRVPPDSTAALEELRKIVLQNQGFTNNRLEDLEDNEVRHGIATVNFGAFPGATEVTATVAVTGLLATHTVFAWPLVIATVDHTVDDVYLEEFSCEVQSVAAGSFVLLVRPHVGLSFGTFQFNYLYL